MSLFKPSELRAFLDEIGKTASKRLSQNFLIDGNIIRKILAAAEVKPNDLILEIGSGPGALTQALLDAGARVIAIEKDRVFAEALHRLQTSDKRLTVYAEDFLECALEKIIPSKAKVVANLPYQITTPILSRLVPLHTLFSTLTVMVQKEVAERYVAKKETPNYSSMTLFLEFYSKPKLCFTVEPTCFYPQPKIQSAVVHLTLKAPPAVSSEEKFFRMTRTAFQHRRKMLRASLKELYTTEKILEALHHMGLKPETRPEQLNLQDFLQLFHELENATFDLPL